MQQPSIWEEQSFFSRQDFIIAGAGFTGLWTAHYLKQKFPGKKVTVIEKGIIPSGASTRNAGFACFGSLTEILSDINTLGQQKTAELVSLRFEGLKLIRQYFSDTLIQYDNCGGYELLTEYRGLEGLDRVNELLYPITNVTQTFIQKSALIEAFGLGNTRYLVENRFEGSLHSGKLIMALAQMVTSMGVQILYGTELKNWEENGAHVSIQTNHKNKLEAGQLILCTNAFTKKLLPDIDLTPARGQVLLTEPIPGLRLKGVFHYDEGFYYFRNMDSCVLLGGARNSSFETEFTFDDVTTLSIQQQLEKFLTDVILPGQKPAVTHRWAGIMGMGSDKFPIVKSLSGRVACAVRLSGMGVALAPMIGKKVANELAIID